jgi:hypothetical protein
MTTPPTPDYRDRSTGLLVFGILEILAGALCALFLLLLLVMSSLGPANALSPPPPVVPALFVYGFGSVTFIWLGIGSIAAQRWARALLLCLSAVGLCAGLVGCALLALTIPYISQTIQQAALKNGSAALPPGFARTMATVAVAILSLIYVIVPGTLFLFYRSPNVKRTCGVRDPVERWTDRCPLPVLALSLLMAFGAVSITFVQGSVHGFPLFGVVVSGAANHLLIGLLAALLLYIAWGLYRLRAQAWWIALACQLLAGVSGVITVFRYDLADLYLRMGVDPRSADATAQILGPAFRWLVPFTILPGLVWLLCVRRYFKAPGPPAVPPLLDGPPQPP